ncbi:MAG: cell division protein FtsZ [Proteobacteria bacterium]|nr:cell division protein FtsZ [Pseudomonadota bacterium]
MFELLDSVGSQAVIKVIGVGGGGGNAVDHMMKTSIDGVDFINANTDAQVLDTSLADTTLQLGEALTKGLGAGADPDVGRQAAMEDRDRIAEAIDGADMIFITAGMGGGTGTGAAPVVAELAREKGILTVAVVTKPFQFEGNRRMKLAEDGLEDLQKQVDSLITIPNQRVLEHMGGDATMVDAFAEANQVLQNAVQGISELITRPGMINVDFADVKTVMSEMGMAMMGSASAVGANRAEEAAQKAISSPLLEDTDLHGAKGLLVNITSGPDLTIGEFSKIGEMMHEFAGEDAVVVVGSAVDESMQGALRVTMVATGLGDTMEKIKAPETPKLEKTTVRNTPQPVLNGPEVGKTKIRQTGFVPNGPSRNSYDGGARVAGGGPDYTDLDVPAFIRNQQAD